MRSKTVIILGATGMVGETLFKSFKRDARFNVVGTSRFKGDYEYFDTKNFEQNLDKILKKLSKVDLVINCIGQTNKKSSVIELIEVNSLFPQKLAGYLFRKKIRLIHISSDAVYSTNLIAVNEKTRPSPETLYGASKLLGEPDFKDCISIRTSIIGVSKKKNNGLLDWARKTKLKKIDGYIDQKWSGCTNLQLSDFCKNLILDGHFKLLNSPIVNFAPIHSITKYEILISAYDKQIVKSKILKKKSNHHIARNLTSLYFDTLSMRRYTSDINKALEELIEFNNIND